MEFKVGEQVRIRRDSKYAYQSKEIGIVRDTQEGGINNWYCVEFPDHGKNGYGECDLESISPETYTTPDGTIYRKLKSLSPESVYANGKYATCQEWKDEFKAYDQSISNFFWDTTIENIIGQTERYPKWLPWLVEHGYIGVEKKKEKKVVVIEGVGWFFNGSVIYPSVIHAHKLTELTRKPAMKMTLEWEE